MIIPNISLLPTYLIKFKSEVGSYLKITLQSKPIKVKKNHPDFPLSDMIPSVETVD